MFFDADGDNDPDLYVVSGGNEFPLGSSQFQDRLYLNDGTGKFNNRTNILPEETTSGSCVVSSDIDKDGDLDLFVGGRHQGSQYPYTPRSFILRNTQDGGNTKFIDATPEVSSTLENIGMVTDAVWTDYNGDSWPDLILVGEWMGIKVFQNKAGKLVEQEFASLEKSDGWWTSIKQMDVDSDGDMDYLLGNAGLNFQLRASEAQPIELFASDFDNDGKVDPILCHYIQGISYPMHSRDELLAQLKPLRRAFNTYASYADVTINEVIGGPLISKTFQLKSYIMESCWLENKNGELKLHTLPDLAQFSTVNSFIDYDFDGDGLKEIIAAGNFYPYKPQIGRMDASMGTLLQFSNNAFTANQNVLSPFWLSGDIRDMALLSFNNNKKMIIVSRNNEPAGVFSINSDFWSNSNKIYK
jgi:hypothetical protein